MKINQQVAVITLVATLTISLFVCDLVGAEVLAKLSIRKTKLVKRSDDSHHSMMHNHLSRKVFDRACAASKDSIDEIVACLTTNDHVMKVIKPEIAADCYKDAFGAPFDPMDMSKHKKLICENRDKFENMTACVYRKTAESLDKARMDKLTEALVDVGLCIINALDG